MKKWMGVFLALLILASCVTGCSFSQKMLDSLSENAEATAKVEAMMTALAENKTEEAKALIHPQSAEETDAAIAQMSNYLGGRKANDIELININVTTSATVEGMARQEEVNYRVTLDDGDVIYINLVYLTNPEGSGFSCYQLVLGVI